jgi:hypothetical protein
VFFCTHNNQVLDSIIEGVMVPVMDVFFGQQPSSKVLFHYPAVSANLFSITPYKSSSGVLA